MFGKNILTFSIIFSILVLIIFIVLFNIKKKPKTKKNALETGFGSYSKEHSLFGCQTSSGKCTEEGFEKVIQYCQPHPATGKGCLDKDGNQTYSSVITQRPCNTQCVSSSFSLEDGATTTDPNPEITNSEFGPGFLKPSFTGRGCNKVVDKNFGIDFTDYFFGPFDETDSKYYLNSCIPDSSNSNFQSYYTQILTCNPEDEKGSNSCEVTCGENSDVLNLKSFTTQKSSSKLLNYFPKEIAENGSIRYVCYDVHNKDQVEILNYVDNVPETFIYPNKCYKHIDTKEITQKIWPTSDGVNIFKINQNQVSRLVNYIDLDQNQNEIFENNIIGIGGLISPDYDINVDSETYIKLRFGSDIALLNKFFNFGFTGMEISSSNRSSTGVQNNNVESRVFYLAIEEYTPPGESSPINYGDYYEEIQKYSMSKNTQYLLYLMSDFFDNNSSAYTYSYFFNYDGYFYFPCNIEDFFTYIEEPTSLSLAPGVLVLQNTSMGTPLSIGGVGQTIQLLLVLENTSTLENRQFFCEATYTAQNSIATVDVSNPGEFAPFTVKYTYTYTGGTVLPLDSNLTSEIYFPGAPNLSTIPGTSVDFSRSFATFNIFTRQFYNSAASYEFLEIKDTTGVQQGSLQNKSPFVVFGTAQNNKLTAYYYPLYLYKPSTGNYETVNFFEFPNCTFYMSTEFEGPGMNTYFRPQFYKDEELVYFNEYTNISCQNYDNSYITIGSSNKYFLSDLNTINSGLNYLPGNVYSVYSKGYDFFTSSNVKSINYTLNQNINNNNTLSSSYSNHYS